MCTCRMAIPVFRLNCSGLGFITRPRLYLRGDVRDLLFNVYNNSVPETISKTRLESGEGGRNERVFND